LKDVERGESHSPDDQEVFVLSKGVKADLSRREVWDDLGSKSSTKIKLTRMEGKLLKVLLARRGQVMTHKELVLQVQGYDVSKWEAPEVLRPVVSRLRRKLAHFPGGEKWITNVRGTGYVFEVGD
jgi:two-component system KDP operon response regulator KdpE